MQLDDNVTSIFEIVSDDNILENKLKKTKKHAQIGGLKRRHLPTCKFRENASKYFCELCNDNFSDDYKIFEGCSAYSLLTIYNLLRANCINEQSLVVGIRKGGGDSSDRADLNELGYNYTYALYKLTVQRPYSLYNYGFFYNPFNSRFMEDIAFNSLVSCQVNEGRNKEGKISKSVKFGNYYLRFGHNFNPTDSYRDYQDCFNSLVIKSSMKILPIYGNYLMLYYYLYVLDHDDLLELNKKDVIVFKVPNKSNVELIIPTSKNKYNWMHMIIYHMWLSEDFYEEDYYNEPGLHLLNSMYQQEYDIITHINNFPQGQCVLYANLSQYNSVYNKIEKLMKQFLDKYFGKQRGRYYEKYLKYKLKYFNLLNKITLNETNLNSIKDQNI